MIESGSLYHASSSLLGTQMGSKWPAFTEEALSDGNPTGKISDTFAKLVEEVIGMVIATAHAT